MAHQMTLLQIQEPDPPAPEILLIHAWLWILQNAPDQRGPCYITLSHLLHLIAKEHYPTARWLLLDPLDLDF